MPTELIMTLANSEKKGEKCVAGKRLTLNERNTYDIHEWIRPVHPDTEEGEIPTPLTLFQGHALEPLDVVAIDFEGSADDPHHPEDMVIVRNRPWNLRHQIDEKYLRNFCDTPENLWGPAHSRRVPEGYVPQMPQPFTLAFIQPSEPCRIEAFYERGYRDQIKFRKRLHLNHNGVPHEFDITDTVFLQRHRLADQARDGGFEMTLDDPEKVFLCLSLTPPFHDYHYKIAATIIEVP